MEDIFNFVSQFFVRKTSNLIFNGTEIYDETSMSNYVIASDIKSFLTLIASTIFLKIVISKTPKPMKKLKFCLINFIIGTLIFHLALFLYPMVVLHPFLFAYSPGIGKNFHPTFNLILLDIIFFSAVLLFDSVLAMTWERCFAVMGINDSPILYYGYRLAILSDIFIFTIAGIGILITPIRNFFIIPPEEIELYLENKIIGLEKIININNLIIVKPFQNEFFPLILVACGLFFGFRIVLIILAAFITFLKSLSMNFKTKLSKESQKLNEMLRLVLYIQYSGYLFCFAIPMLIWGYVFYFKPSPSMAINWCLYMIFTLELYEIVLTGIFIKPYRKAIFKPFYRLKDKIIGKKSRISTILPKYNSTMENTIISRTPSEIKIT